MHTRFVRMRYGQRTNRKHLNQEVSDEMKRHLPVNSWTYVSDGLRSQEDDLRHCKPNASCGDISVSRNLHQNNQDEAGKSL